MLDVDDQGRVLTASGGALIETGTGAANTLADGLGVRTAMYLPGERAVVVEHGDPPRISLLWPDDPHHVDDLEGRLLDVLPGRIVYCDANSDVIIRNVLTGEEQAVYDRGGTVLEATVSPDSRFVVVRLTDDLLMVATMPETEDDHVVPVPGRAPGAQYRHLHWLPDGTSLVAVSRGELFRYDLEDEDWHSLFSLPDKDSRALPAPDGHRIAVTGDGTLALYGMDGAVLFEAAAPGVTPDTSVAWSPDSAAVAVLAGDQVVAMHAATGITTR